MPRSEHPETHLGDGLYVSINGGVIKLRAPRGAEAPAVIYLEAEMLGNFLIWLRALRAAALEHGPSAVE